MVQRFPFYGRRGELKVQLTVSQCVEIFTVLRGILVQAMFSATPALLSYRQPGIGNSALHWAAARNNEELISWLLVGGIDPNLANGSGATALHSAASNDSWEAVNLLLRYDCNTARVVLARHLVLN